jgi:DNA-binding transcriptional ArsR family regulator
MHPTNRLKLKQPVERTDIIAQRVQPSVPDRHLSKFFKALSDQTRREILRLLERHPRSVGEIVDNFQLSQPTISRHLSVLREADLVIDQRRGQHVIYRINASTLSDSIFEFFGDFRQPREQLDAVTTPRVTTVRRPRQRPARPTL